MIKLPVIIFCPNVKLIHFPSHSLHQLAQLYDNVETVMNTKHQENGIPSDKGNQS